MIWLYIIATIVAQAIVVVLLIEFINRRSNLSTPKQEAESPPPSAPETEEAPAPAATSRPDPVGPSGFDCDRFRAMLKEVVKECIEERVEENDVEFDNDEKQSANKTGTDPEAPEARMTPEMEAKAWEDYRDAEALLDREDNSVAPANPMASGAGFDEIAKATVVLETPEGRSLDDLKFAVNIYKTVDGTQFTGCLPDALLEKLRMCHEKVELKAPFPDEEEEQVAPEPPAPVKKPKRAKKEQPKPEVREPEIVNPAPLPKSLNFFSKQSSKQ